jgi:hypothetical protein
VLSGLCCDHQAIILASEDPKMNKKLLLATGNKTLKWGVV